MKLGRSYLFGSLAAALVTVTIGVGCEEGSTPDATPDGGSLPGIDGGGSSADGAVVSKCTAPTGPGTTHNGNLDADAETWTAAGSPHIVDANITIYENQSVTLEPCAVVRIQKSLSLLVRGKLLAEGAADRPITIEAADAEPWALIEASPTSELRFVYTTVSGGGFANGSALDRVAMLDIRGNQDDPTQGRLHADHLTVKDSASLGVLLREGGGFSPTSKDVTITGGASYPLNTWARAAGTIPTGTYTGNQTDEIIIAALGTRDAIREDATLANRGVPYLVQGSQLNVGAPTGTAKATLTIEAGVNLRFAKDSSLLLDNSTTNGPANGVLRAIGTAAAPIVFTSAEATPAAGNWKGLFFEGQPDANNKIDYAKISYAGGEGGVSSHDCPSPANAYFTNHGGVVIYGGKPASAFITNTTFENIAGDGIVRGWTGDVIDFLPTNTFSGVTQCNQTYPKPLVGSCPAPAPCPKT